MEVEGKSANSVQHGSVGWAAAGKQRGRSGGHKTRAARGGTGAGPRSASPPSSPPAGPTASAHQLHRERRALDTAPRAAPTRADWGHRREGGRHRQAVSAAAGLCRLEGTQPAEHPHAPRCSGSRRHQQRSPRTAVRALHTEERPSARTLILLSTPLLSSVCTSRSRSSVSSSVAAAAILFLPDNRPNRASGGTGPADSPPPREALTQRRVRGHGAQRNGCHPQQRSRRDAAELRPPGSSAAAAPWKLRRRTRSATAAGSGAREVQSGGGSSAPRGGPCPYAAPQPPTGAQRAGCERARAAPPVAAAAQPCPQLPHARSEHALSRADLALAVAKAQLLRAGLRHLQEARSESAESCLESSLNNSLIM